MVITLGRRTVLRGAIIAAATTLSAALVGCGQPDLAPQQAGAAVPAAATGSIAAPTESIPTPTAPSNEESTPTPRTGPLPWPLATMTAVEVGRATRQASYNVTPVPPNPHAPTPTEFSAAPTAPLPFPHRAAGDGTIVENGQAPISSSIFRFQNYWYSESAGLTTTVYAGSEGQDPEQGVVLVMVMPAADSQAMAAVRTPTKAGAVRITDATGQILILQAANGQNFRFDVASRAFSTP